MFVSKSPACQHPVPLPSPNAASGSLGEVPVPRSRHPQKQNHCLIPMDLDNDYLDISWHILTMMVHHSHDLHCRFFYHRKVRALPLEGAIWNRCHHHFAKESAKPANMGLICARRRRSNWASYLAWQQHTGAGRKSVKRLGIYDVSKWNNENRGILYAMFKPISSFFASCQNGLYPLWNMAVRKKLTIELWKTRLFHVWNTGNQETAKNAWFSWSLNPWFNWGSTTCGQVTTRASAALPHRRRTLPCAVLGIQHSAECMSLKASVHMIVWLKFEVAMG